MAAINPSMVVFFLLHIDQHQEYDSLVGLFVDSSLLGLLQQEVELIFFPCKCLTNRYQFGFKKLFFEIGDLQIFIGIGFEPKTEAGTKKFQLAPIRGKA